MKDENRKQQKKSRNFKTDKNSTGKSSNFSKRQNSKANNCYTNNNSIHDFTGHSNDVVWWLPTGISAQQVASYPWNTMAGFNIDDAVANSKGVEYYSTEANNIPGIMRIVLQSTFPLSTGDSSPLNRASLGLFADILTKNSSNVPFEHTDLMMSMFAFSDIDSWLCKGIRAYALLRNYPVQNKYMAQTLISACGFNYDSLAADPYGFISRLNVYISRRNRFYIPKNFGWRSREMWLSQAIYKDSDDPKSQFYVFDKDSYSIWSPRTSSTGSELLQRSCLLDYDSEITVDEYFTLLEKMLTPLENDQDIYIMQGYLLKRYEASEFAVFPMVSPDVQIVPVIDYPVLTMIQNLKLYEDANLSEDTYTTLSQREGHFTYDPTFKTHFLNTGNILLTSCYNDPTPDQTIEATRLIIPIDTGRTIEQVSGTPVVRVNAAALNADVARKVLFYSLKSDGGLTVFEYTPQDFGLIMDNLVPISYYLLTNISYFDFHPIIPVLTTSGSNDAFDFLGFLGDFDNTMILTQENIKKLTDVLTYGIVNVVQPIK